MEDPMALAVQEVQMVLTVQMVLMTQDNQIIVVTLTRLQLFNQTPKSTLRTSSSKNASMETSYLLIFGLKSLLLNVRNITWDLIQYY